MEIRICTVRSRPAPQRTAYEELLRDYCARVSRSCSCTVAVYATEQKLLASLGAGRRRGVAVLLDSRGRSMGTEAFAQLLEHHRREGAEQLVFAVGPADGWSAEARNRADLLLSLGPMTLPHQLAAVVLAEQIYRAFTIIEGHPYHLGHGVR